MMRYCVCGIPIQNGYCLCIECRKLYGLDRKEWPEWLREWMKSYQAELQYERRHDNDLSLDAMADIELI